MSEFGLPSKLLILLVTKVCKRKKNEPTKEEPLLPFSYESTFPLFYHFPSSMFLHFFHKIILKWHIELRYLHMSNQRSTNNNPKTITNRFNIRENMCVEENSFPRFLQSEHEILDEFATYRIKSTHRFIEEYEFSIMQYCLCESDTLQHAFGIGIEFFPACMCETYLFKNDIFSFFEIWFLHPIECSIEIQEFISREVLVEIGILWHKSDAFANSDILHGTAEYLDISSCWLDNPEDCLHGCGFSWTIWSKKTKYFSLFKGEWDVRENLSFPDFLREVWDGEKRCWFWHRIYYRKSTKKAIFLARIIEISFIFEVNSLKSIDTS